jgi:hypothetical protein
VSSLNSMNIPETVARALALHQSGRPAEAGALYQAVLGADPGHFEALHFLGLVQAQRGNFHEADGLMSRSLVVNSGTTDAALGPAPVFARLALDARTRRQSLVSLGKAVSAGRHRRLGERGPSSKSATRIAGRKRGCLRHDQCR